MSSIDTLKITQTTVNQASATGNSLNTTICRAYSFNQLVDKVGAIIDGTISTATLAGATIAITGASSFGEVNSKKQVTNTGGAYATPIVLTAAQTGRVILVNDAAGLDFTLPAVSSTEVGTYFDFLVTVSVTSNLFRVTSATGDLMTGSILLVDDTAAYTAPQSVVKKPVTSFLVMGMNGTTTGGKIGTKIRFTALSATQWFVEGNANGSGVLATPFS